MRPNPFALCGVLTGAAAAAGTLLPLGEVRSIEVAGHCLGLRGASGICQGIDAGFYLFPGLVFGATFAVLLRRGRHLSTRGAVLYAAVAILANAVAVFTCIALIDPVDRLLPLDSPDLNIAIPGLIAGGLGGGLLAMAHAALEPGVRRALPLAVGAALGLLTPLVAHFPYLGDFAFYMLWQGGYAAALAAALPRPAGS